MSHHTEHKNHMHSMCTDVVMSYGDTLPIEELINSVSAVLIPNSLQVNITFKIAS
jgi:hypothetical protein